MEGMLQKFRTIKEGHKEIYINLLNTKQCLIDADFFLIFFIENKFLDFQFSF